MLAFVSGFSLAGLTPVVAASLWEGPMFQYSLRVLGALVPLFVGIFLMLPRGGADRSPIRYLGAALVVLSLVLLVTYPLTSADGAVAESSATTLWSLPQTLSCYTFHALALVSVSAAALMITARNPVYSALWFSLVLLSNSGLYLLQGADFLAASTIIVYAGAIVVTFLFVIMLAQPNGAARYDRFAREGSLSAITGLLLSGVLIAALHLAMRTEPRGAVAGVASRPADSVVAVHTAANGNSLMATHPHVTGLGRTLFTDQVVSVEITGLLLLAAVVGAMLIAGHRTEETHVRK